MKKSGKSQEKTRQEKSRKKSGKESRKKSGKDGEKGDAGNLKKTSRKKSAHGQNFERKVEIKSVISWQLMGCKNCALCADHYYNTVAIHRSFHAFSNQSKHKLQAYSKSVTLIDNILTNKIVVKITRSNILCDILDYYSSTVFLILFFFYKCPAQETN